MPKSNLKSLDSMPKQGEMIYIPETGMTLKPELHPDSDLIEKRLAIDDRPYIMDFFKSQKATNTYIAQRIPAWGGLCYPHALKDRIYSIQQMMNVATLMDEEFTTPSTQSNDKKLETLRKAYFSALDGISPPPSTPIARMLFHNLEYIKESLNSRPQVQQRLLNAIRNQINSLAKPIVRNIDVLPYDRYMELRRIDVFGEWTATLTEYAIDVDMTEHLENSSSLRKVRIAAIDSITLANDLFSFRKEIPAKDSLNAIWILMRDKKLEIQQAINLLASLFFENEVALINSRNDVLGSKLGTNQEVCAYMTELEHLHSGNAEFHTFSTRYQGIDFQGERFTSGEVPIGDFPTLQEIAANDTGKRRPD
ncbi:terpene synthase family protein [Pseudomonas gingeri]|uniref:Terpene synthase n=1 Tax=Pseudomonas gingeri TaxID=117681 RepID=A0A7Y7YA16_9PSED|nr:terpene synthase family protein [Pseudomonas gingeri]NWB26861.1 methyltransferase type 12 [Pseudomonas gingeri]NWC32589.1 methyltransferase type 12 [Pseudomonas gingeri]NWD05115.1 methyltransferase type 12 [Pseudomonas gingeri]NWD46570.1 methyltransferase type 12 [Pseudomonas gingeri]NWE36473.1 methyltransferase type 12 [Pseudomonas gingeri]